MVPLRGYPWPTKTLTDDGGFEHRFRVLEEAPEEVHRVMSGLTVPALGTGWQYARPLREPSPVLATGGSSASAVLAWVDTSQLVVVGPKAFGELVPARVGQYRGWMRDGDLLRSPAPQLATTQLPAQAVFPQRSSTPSSPNQQASAESSSRPPEYAKLPTTLRRLDAPILPASQIVVVLYARPLSNAIFLGHVWVVSTGDGRALHCNEEMVKNARLLGADAVLGTTGSGNGEKSIAGEHVCEGMAYLLKGK